MSRFAALIVVGCMIAATAFGFEVGRLRGYADCYHDVSGPQELPQ